MTVIAVNGSPRKNWNTHILLQKALEGAESQDAAVELVHLRDLDYSGCIACLECKRKGGRSRGKCAVKDGLTPVLEKITACDALIIGSPIYFGEVTGMTRSFMERLLFQNISYDMDRTPLTKRRIQTAFVYAMNVADSQLEPVGYADRFKANEMLLTRILGPSRTLVCTETLQTNDYGKYHMSMFDEAERRQRRKDVFPLDCQKAFDMGADMAAHANT